MHNNIWNRRFLRIFTAAILLQMGNQFIMTVLPLYLDGLNFAPSVLGMGHALSAMAAMAGAPLAGALADRKGKSLVLCSGFLIMAAGMVGFIALPMALPIIVIRLVQGFGISAGSVSQTAIATDVLPQEKVKSGLSYFGIAGTIAGAAGSFVGLRLIFGENYAPVWLGGALLFGVGAILGLTFRGTKAPAVPEQAENEHTAARTLGFAGKERFLARSSPVAAYGCRLRLCLSPHLWGGDRGQGYQPAVYPAGRRFSAGYLCFWGRSLTGCLTCGYCLWRVCYCPGWLLCVCSLWAVISCFMRRGYSTDSAAGSATRPSAPSPCPVPRQSAGEPLRPLIAAWVPWGTRWVPFSGGWRRVLWAIGTFMVSPYFCP